MDELGKHVRKLGRQILKNQWIIKSFGIVVFILILFQIDWPEFFTTISRVDPVWVIGSLILQAVALFVTTWRWKFIMQHLDIHVSYGRSMVHQLIGTGMAMITPGQLGEFIKVVYHRGMGFPIPESALSIIIDRFYDLAMLCLFGFIGIGVIFGIQIEHLIIIIVILILVGLAAFLYLRDKENNAQRVALILTRVSPKPYKEMIRQNVENLIQQVTSMKPGLILSCLLLSFANYSLLLMKVYMLALSVHMQVEFWFFASAVPLFRLVGLVPITISGIGTRDAVIIYILSSVGIPPESSLILSVLSLVTFQLQALVGVLFWWRFPPTPDVTVVSPTEAVLGER